VAGRLKELYKENPKEYIRCWQDIGTFVKFGSLNDEKFKKQVEDILVFRTTYKPTETDETPAVEVQTEEGDAWQEVGSETTPSVDEKGYYYTTLSEYLERNKERHENRVFYCNDEAAQATYVELHKSQGLEVLFLDSFIDTHFISFLEREHSDVKFSRVDSELDDTLIDKENETEIVDPNTNKTRSEQIKELFEKTLNNPKINIRTESLKSENTPPAMVLLPEAMRRLQDMTAVLQQQKADFPEDHVLLINTAHPLIQNLSSLSQGSIIQEGGTSPSAELATQICHHVYDLALMAQKGFDAQGMKAFVERSNQVLTQLTQRAM
jgi:molecular chaperone HtpG